MKLVYKFLPPTRALFFNDGLLRFTQPADLNDPFECTPVLSDDDILASKEHILGRKRQELLAESSGKKWEIRQIDKHIRKAAQQFDREVASDPAKFREYFFAQGAENINGKLGILSLSRRWDSSLMWAHYSLSHQGFCVGFDATADFFTKSAMSPDGGGVLRPVSYGPHRIRVPIQAYKRIDFEVMFRKSDEWSYEEEERMIGPFEKARKVIGGTPWKIYLFEIPLDTVREVVLGARTGPEVKQLAAHFCAERTAPIFRAQLSNKTFNMERVCEPSSHSFGS